MGGRIGILKTRSGTLETPALLPVVHPKHQLIPAKQLRELGFRAIMTNAYLTLKYHGAKARAGIHRLLSFDGIVMTDSGGYQVLRYGQLDTTPLQIAEYQAQIGSDIGIILDRPTGLYANRRHAELSVKATVDAAAQSLKVIERGGTLWAGPIQGGSHMDLVEECAKRISEMPFQLYALGSPTQVMENYRFSTLVRMIAAAKSSLPIEKPLHLFGAGHPLTVPLAVSLGCDLFDSASYVLYARSGRYMAEQGTLKLRDLSYLPCTCPVCVKHSAAELKALEAEARAKALSLHNLYALMKEVSSCKEAIEDGRLWEYTSQRAMSHPRAREAFSLLAKRAEFLEDGAPTFKRRGIFFTAPPDHVRPEVIRHRKRLLNLTFREPASKLLIIPVPPGETQGSRGYIPKSRMSIDAGKSLVAMLSFPLGIIPLEIADVYPLSQHESSMVPDHFPSICADLTSDIAEVSRAWSVQQIEVRRTPGYDLLLRMLLERLGPMVKVTEATT